MYGGFGVGVVGVAIGAVTGAMTLSKASDVEPQCANNICAPTAKDDLESANTLSTVSTIAFAVGGAGILAGAIGLLLPRRSSVTPTRGSLAWEWVGVWGVTPGDASASSSRSRLTLSPAPSGLGGRF